MATRTFAQINCSLLRSRKLRGLSHAERWVYVCAHLTPQGTFSGIFVYPLPLWAVDASMPQDELEAAIGNLVAANLIEWDATSETVRIVGLHRQRPPENASRVLSLTMDLSALLSAGEMETEGMILRTASECIVAALVRSQNWKPESTDREKLQTYLGEFLRRTYQEHEEAFLGALHDELQHGNKAARGELGSLLPPLLTHKSDTVPTPCPDRADTRDVDETRRRQDQDGERDEDETTRISPFSEASTPRQVEPVDLLRRRDRQGPTEATKRSALVTKAG